MVIGIKKKYATSLLLICVYTTFCSCSEPSPAGPRALDDSTRWEVLMGANGTINSLAGFGSGIFVGGYFTAGEDIPMKHIGYFNTTTNRFDPVTTTLTSEGPDPYRGVYSLLKIEEALYFGGVNLIAQNGDKCMSIGMYNPTMNDLSPVGDFFELFSSSYYNEVYSLQQYDKGILMLGRFGATSYDCHTLAFYDLVMKEWRCTPLSTYSIYVNDRPTMLVWGDSVYLGGGTLIRYNAAHNTLQKLIDDENVKINTIAKADKYLYIGGHFEAIGNRLLEGMARYDPITDEWSSLELEGENYFSITKILLDGDKLYVAKSVSQNFYSPPTSELLRYDLVSHEWHTLGRDLEGTINDMVVQGDYLYLGGDFKKIGSKAVKGFARYQLRP